MTNTDESDPPMEGRVDLTIGAYRLYRFAVGERLLLIEDTTVLLPSEEDEAAWDAMIHEARSLGFGPAYDEPDLEVGPLAVFYLEPLSGGSTSPDVSL